MHKKLCSAHLGIEHCNTPGGKSLSANNDIMRNVFLICRTIVFWAKLDADPITLSDIPSSRPLLGFLPTPLTARGSKGPSPRFPLSRGPVL